MTSDKLFTLARQIAAQRSITESQALSWLQGRAVAARRRKNYGRTAIKTNQFSNIEPPKDAWWLRD